MRPTNAPKHFFLLTMVMMLCCLAWHPAALAAPFDTTQISATGDIAFDDLSSYGNTSGAFSARETGVDTTATFAGSAATGDNPVNAVFTDTGDGFGMAGTAEERGIDSYLAGLDFELVLGNTSADIYEITLKVDFSNTVDADGDDAYADSEFTIRNKDTLTEYFFTDLVSDTVFGDHIGGIATGAFGDPLSDAGASLFTLTLNPGDVMTLEGNWTAEGGGFVTGGRSFFEFNAFVSIDTVENISSPIPEPGTFALLGLGLLGFARLSRRKTI